MIDQDLRKALGALSQSKVWNSLIDVILDKRNKSWYDFINMSTDKKTKEKGFETQGKYLAYDDIIKFLESEAKLGK